MNRSLPVAGRNAQRLAAATVLPALVSLTAGAGDAGSAAAAAGNPAPVRKKITRKQAIATGIALLSKATGADAAKLQQSLVSLTAPPATQTQKKEIDPTDLVALATQRRADLVGLQKAYGLGDEFVSLCMSKGLELAAAQEEAKKQLSAKHTPLHVQVGSDNNLVSLGASLSDAIRLRAGAKIEKPHERSEKMRHLSLIDMGRQYLHALGHPDAFTLGRAAVDRLVMSPRELRSEPGGSQMVMLAESIGDFPNVLKDAINKTLNQAYRDANPTWKKWARRTTNPDFKQINRVNLSESPSLQTRLEGQGIQYVQLSDTNEYYFLSEYVAGISLTRRARVNDDLDAFNRIPMLQGSACGRKEEDVAYSQLTSNPTMLNDSIALFNSAHGNYVASGSGAAPSVTTLQTAYQKMRTQKGPAGAARLNIQPKFLMVPVALEASSLQLINSTQLLAVISTTSAAPQTVGASNPYANRLEVISNPRFDDVNTGGWYVSAFYGDGQVDTVEVCFLEDEPEPVLKQETDFDTEDQKYAVRHTVGSKVIDFRGLFYNYGS